MDTITYCMDTYTYIQIHTHTYLYIQLSDIFAWFAQKLWALLVAVGRISAYLAALVPATAPAPIGCVNRVFTNGVTKFVFMCFYFVCMCLYLACM